MFLYQACICIFIFHFITIKMSENLLINIRNSNSLINAKQLEIIDHLIFLFIILTSFIPIYLPNFLLAANQHHFLFRNFPFLHFLGTEDVWKVMVTKIISQLVSLIIEHVIPIPSLRILVLISDNTTSNCSALALAVITTSNLADWTLWLHLYIWKQIYFKNNI